MNGAFSLFDFFKKESNSKGGLFFGNIEKEIVLGRTTNTAFYGNGFTFRNETAFKWKKGNGKVIIAPENEANPHILIVGSSGFGKSTLLKSLIIDIAGSNIPIILFDGHNEHEELIRRLGGNVYNVNYSGINIMSLDGLSVNKRISELTRFLSSVYKFGYLQEGILHNALYYTYRKFCSSLDSAFIDRTPTLNDLANELAVFSKNSKNFSEKERIEHVRQRIVGLVKGMPSENYLDINRINGINSFSIKDMGEGETKSIYIHEIIARIYGNMKTNKREQGILFYIIIDESKFTMENTGDILSNMITESRKFGYGIIIVSNSARSFSESIVSNASIFLSFCMREPKELAYISSILGGNSQKASMIKQSLYSAKKYEAIMVSYNNSTPLFIRTPTVGKISEKMNGREVLPIKNDLEYAAILEPVKKPVLVEELIKNIGQDNELLINKILESGKVDKFEFTTGDKTELWIRRQNKSVSIEHEVLLIKILKSLRAGEISCHMNLGGGPDIIAYLGKERIAIEYETGKKNIEKTSIMLKERQKLFRKTIVIVNNDAYKFYKEYFGGENMIVLSSNDIEIISGYIK
jgi:energy-coupling factor transporter ATP-binding protein EcfA2